MKNFKSLTVIGQSDVCQIGKNNSRLKMFNLDWDFHFISEEYGGKKRTLFFNKRNC